MIAQRFLCLAAAVVVLSSCSSQIEVRDGSSKGYNSARFVRRAPNAPPPATANERKIHGMIQSAIASQFNANGVTFGQGQAELIVSYLVVYQETGMTTYFDDYFGASGEDIADEAHELGVAKGKRRDYYQAAGLVIDITDSRTNEQVYRNYYKADIVQGTSDSVRAQRINAAVAQTLAPFFR